MIRRTLEPHAVALAQRHPVLTITGPRQSGKTTLCRAAFPDRAYVSLEPLAEREFARTDPRGLLAQYPAGEPDRRCDEQTGGVGWGRGNIQCGHWPTAKHSATLPLR